MKLFLMALTFALGITLLEGSIASAQDGGQVQITNYGSMQDIIYRLESLEGTLNDQSALYFGAELVLAKPYFEDEFDSADSDEARYHYEVSPRFFGGFRTASGFGGRARYWQWNQSSNPGPSPSAPFRLDVQALDIETTMEARLGRIDLTLFGGGRYGKVGHKTVDARGTTFEGFGPTLGVDLMIPARCSNLSLLGGIRYSALFGHTAFIDDNDDSSRGDDDLVTGFDAQLGVQYSRCVANGRLNARAYVESQLWADATDNADVSLETTSSSDEDLGFLAFVFGIEYIY